MATIQLYELEGCPYCRKVRDKLDDLGLEYESIAVPSMKARRSKVKEISGQTGVPVLVDPDNGVEGMPESSDIVAYLEETYGDGAA